MGGRHPAERQLGEIERRRARPIGVDQARETLREGGAEVVLGLDTEQVEAREVAGPGERRRKRVALVAEAGDGEALGRLQEARGSL